MSIVSELMEWAEESECDGGIINADGYEELQAIAQRIRKANNEAVNKAHADGERNALKQVRSRSEDYRKGYEAGYAKAKEERMENAEGTSRFEQGSSITDELREYLDQKDGWGLTHSLAKAIAKIADRIDERHSKEMKRMWDDAEGADLKAFEATHVKLPLDADGVPIHVGDEVEVGHSRVEAIGFGNVASGIDDYGVFSQSEDGSYEWFNARFLHHVQPDSWERIIGDARFGFINKETDGEYVAELVERCRRLAGE